MNLNLNRKEELLMNWLRIRHGITTLLGVPIYQTCGIVLSTKHIISDRLAYAQDHNLYKIHHNLTLVLDPIIKKVNT
jgi:hypothetical protein